MSSFVRQLSRPPKHEEMRYSGSGSKSLYPLGQIEDILGSAQFSELEEAFFRALARTDRQ